MAITWEVSITNVNVNTKRADITATRTDSSTGVVETYSFRNAIVGTTQERQALLDLVWQNHLNYISSQSAIDVFISGLEQSAKTNLEGRE